MSLIAIKKSIDIFLSSKESQVLLLKGEWGVGKTHFWKDYIKKCDVNKLINKEYVYLSLYGINDIDEFKVQLYSKNDFLKGYEPNKVSDNALKKFNKLRLSFSNLTSFLKVPYIDTNKAHKHVLSQMVNSINNVLICIDDIERADDSLGNDVLFGQLSTLKNERNCKIVLISNNQYIDKDKVRPHKEKLIDREINFSLTFEETYEEILNTDDSYTEIIKKHCKHLEIKNFRTIKRIKSIADELYPYFDDCNDESFDSFIKTIVLSVHCNDSSDTTIPDINYLLSYKHDPWREIYEDDEPDEENIRLNNWRDYIETFDYHTEAIDKVLINYVADGIFNEELFIELKKSIIEKYNEVNDEEIINNNFKEAWAIYHRGLNCEKELFVENLMGIIDEPLIGLNPMDINATAYVMRGCSLDLEANNLIDKYIEELDEENEFLSFGTYSFENEIKDKYLLEKREQKRMTMKQNISADDVMGKILTDQFPNQAEIDRLAENDSDYFYEKIKEKEGKELTNLIKNLQRFGGYAETTDHIGQTKIYNNVKAALIKIGKEDDLNKMRVRKFGITEEELVNEPAAEN